MGVEGPCVRVDRESGEATRRALAELDLVDGTRRIVAEEGCIYVPVTDAAAVTDAPGVPDDYEVVTRAVPARETQTTPADLLGFEPSYERLGDVVVLREDDPARAREIATAVMDSDLPVKTVLNSASDVQGRERVRDWEVLAGDGTETVHREYGCEFALDVTEVYFSPRLATERHRVTEQVRASEAAFDMFAGVGPYAVAMAARGATVVATDVNPVAVEYLRENARRNGVEERVTAVEGDVRAVAPEYEGWADRVVMNLPHSADDFLDSAVTIAGDECVVHLYDIQPEADPFGPGREAFGEAVAGTGYDFEVLEERMVRSYAPGVVNVCLDVRLAR